MGIKERIFVSLFYKSSIDHQKSYDLYAGCLLQKLHLGACFKCAMIMRGAGWGSYTDAEVEVLLSSSLPLCFSSSDIQSHASCCEHRVLTTYRKVIVNWRIHLFHKLTQYNITGESLYQKKIWSILLALPNSVTI